MSIEQFWDQRFSGKQLVYGHLPNDFLALNTQRLKAGGDILCLAEGEGRNAIYLAKQGFNVTAVDISSVALEKAKQLAHTHKANVNLVHADLADYDLGSKKWDGIVAIFMHLPPDLRENVFGKIAAALRPTGIFIGEFYRPEQLNFTTGGPRELSMLYSTNMLSNDLKDLSFILLEEREREVFEGIGHTGMAAVSQVIAQKIL